MVRLLYFGLLILISAQLNAQNSIETIFEQNFSTPQLKEDFEVFRKGLEKLHPGLSRYTSTSAMDSLFKEAKNAINRDLSYAEFYKIIGATIAEIKCQHTVAAPDSEALNRIRKEGKFFPLRVFWEFVPIKAYAAFDFSSEANLAPGTIIRSIDGQSIEDIYSYLIPYFPSDGNILTNKQNRLQYALDFQMWYYLLIDRPRHFQVELETTDGQIFNKTYAAVNLKELKKNYKKYTSPKDPGLKKYTSYYVTQEKKNNSKPIRYEFIQDDVALLYVGNFHAPKSEKLVSEAFAAFRDNDIKHLIIDVRYNGGGSDILGRYLFNHLIDKPTVYFDSLYTATGISDTTFLYAHTDKTAEWREKNLPLVTQMPDGRYTTKPEANKGLLVQQPKKNNFKGEVYIMMNGRSASTTSEFTAATHSNQLATFIGEESGGAYHGGNGGDFANLSLPNSKIEITIPLSKYVMNSRETSYLGQGTLPDFAVQTTMQDILGLRDPQLAFALELIGKRR